MAEPTNAPQGSAQPPEPAPSDGNPAEDTADKRLKREAQQLRERLREAEAERDTLRGQVDGYVRAEIEREATGAGKLHAGSDLLRDRELSEFVTEDGSLDTEAVAEAVAQLRTDRPHLGQPEERKLPSKPHESLRPSGGGDPTAEPQPPSWHNVLSGD